MDSTTKPTLTSVVPAEGTGVEFDPQVAIAQAIGSLGVRMNLGVRMDTIVYSAQDGWVTFRIGSGRVHRVATVVYTPMDLYDVEISRINLRTLEVTIEAQETGVFGDQLADALIRLHDEAVSA